MNEGQISKEFISLLEKAGKAGGFDCGFWYSEGGRLGRRIIKLSGSLNCLIYFKVRSAKPIRWGVTANRIKELNESGLNWWLILLFESAQTGYFVNSEDVKRCLSIWPLGSDGDYKVQPGTYLQFHEPFQSVSEVINNLR